MNDTISSMDFSRRSSLSIRGTTGASGLPCPQFPATGTPRHTQESDRASSQGTPYKRMPSTRSNAQRSMENSGVLATQGKAMGVFIRVRPFSTRELSQKGSCHSTVRIDAENPTLITLLDPQKEFRPKDTYVFSRCFWSVFDNDNADGSKKTEIEGLKESVDAFDRGQAVYRRTKSTTSVFSSAALAAFRSSGTDDSVVEYTGAGSSAVLANASVTHPPYASQESVYEYVGRPIMLNTLEGYNGCIFAYGQTGSGKTFTMLGYAPRASEIEHDLRRRSVSAALGSNVNETDDAEPYARSETAPWITGQEEGPDVVDNTRLDMMKLQGIIPRICGDLFQGLREKRETEASNSYRVEVSYFEIYMEKVYDLIRPQKEVELKIRQNPVTGPYVEGLSKKIVSNEKEVGRIIRKGIQQRHTAATKMNDHSSRSHAILTFNIHQLYLDKDDNSRKMQSKLNLVDLAGCERTGQIQEDIDEQTSGISINLSLTTLGRVIDCLAEASRSRSYTGVVPYRDSKLTYLLMDSLGGNSQTAMVATISPHAINYEEMRSTVRYASRARQIKLRPEINEDPLVRQVKELTTELEALRRRMRESGQSEFSREYVQELQRRNAYLERRNEELERMNAELRAEMEGTGKLTPRLVADRKQLGKSEPGGGESLAFSRKASSAVLSSVESFDKDAPKKVSSASFYGNHKHMEQKINRLERQLEDIMLSEDDKSRLIDQFDFLFYRSAIDSLFRVLHKKGDLVFSEITSALQQKLRQQARTSVQASKGSRSISSPIQKARPERSADAQRLRSQQNEELDKTTKRYEKMLKELKEQSTQAQRQLSDRHKDALCALEDRLKGSKILYDKEIKRLQEERREVEMQYEEKLLAAKSMHRDEIQRLREQLNSTQNDKNRSTNVLKQSQDGYTKKIEILNAEFERYRKSKEAELSRLKVQLASDNNSHEAEKMEAERLRRLLEIDSAELRRAVSKAKEEKEILDNEWSEKNKLLDEKIQKMLEVIAILLKQWDEKSPDLNGSIKKLRQFIENATTGFQHRELVDLKIKARHNYDQDIRLIDEKQQQEVKQFNELVSRLKRAQSDHQESVQRFQKELMEQLSKVHKNHQEGDSTPRDAVNSLQSTISSIVSARNNDNNDNNDNSANSPKSEKKPALNNTTSNEKNKTVKSAKKIVPETKKEAAQKEYKGLKFK